MSWVNPERDDVLAQRGYVRVAHVATVLGMSASAVSRWRTRYPTIRFATSGRSCWLFWEDVRTIVNRTVNEQAIGWADVLKLPLSAEEALQVARKQQPTK